MFPDLLLSLQTSEFRHSEETETFLCKRWVVGTSANSRVQKYKYQRKNEKNTERCAGWSHRNQTQHSQVWDVDSEKHHDSRNKDKHIFHSSFQQQGWCQRAQFNCITSLGHIHLLCPRLLTENAVGHFQRCVCCFCTWAQTCCEWRA